MTHVRLLLLLLLLMAPACEKEDRCAGIYRSCTEDEDCELATAPGARCLDDRETGYVCVYYLATCPTMLQWAQCAGKDDRKSSWAGRCVRPEFLPDSATFHDGGPDMSTMSTDGGPS